MHTVIVCLSFHHKNTLKIARAMADTLDAGVVKPNEVGKLNEVDLIGFGSGIYAFRHHSSLLGCVDDLPQRGINKKAFIFSTRGWGPASLYHYPMRRRLQSAGYSVLGEFSCLGYDTFGPLRLIGGINPNRPDEDNIDEAQQFAQSLLSEMETT